MLYKSDEASQGAGRAFVGVHHIGFWGGDVVEQGKIARGSGAAHAGYAADEIAKLKALAVLQQTAFVCPLPELPGLACGTVRALA